MGCESYKCSSFRDTCRYSLFRLTFILYTLLLPVNSTIFKLPLISQCCNSSIYLVYYYTIIQEKATRRLSGKSEDWEQYRCKSATRCEGVEVWRCEGVEVWRCEGVKMWRGVKKVWRCEDIYTSAVCGNCWPAPFKLRDRSSLPKVRRKGKHFVTVKRESKRA